MFQVNNPIDRIQRGGGKVVVNADGTISLTGAVSSAGVVQLANGTAAAPSVTFASDPDTGLYRIGANQLGIALNGTKVIDIASGAVAITSSVATPGAGVGALQIDAASLTSGNGAALQINVNGLTSSNAIRVNSTSTAFNGGSLFTAYATGNTVGSKYGGYVVVSGTASLNTGWYVEASGGTANVGLEIGSGSLKMAATNGFIELSEMSAPTGVADKARLFAVDSGAGKTILKAIFGSGAAQTIATEP